MRFANTRSYLPALSPPFTPSASVWIYLFNIHNQTSARPAVTGSTIGNGRTIGKSGNDGINASDRLERPSSASESGETDSAHANAMDKAALVVKAAVTLIEDTLLREQVMLPEALL